MNKPVSITARRNFLKLSAAAGTLLFSCPMSTLAQMSGRVIPDIITGDLGVFIEITTDNKITIGAPIPDMGQGVSTAVPMLLADELDADWDTVKVEKLKPYLTKVNGRVEEQKNIRQNAGGSQGIREVWKPIREAGAIARRQLMMAAASRLDVPLNDLSTSKSHVIHKSTDKKIPYGELIGDASKIPMPEDIPQLKTADQFNIVGHEIRNEISPDIVRGVPTFGLDMRIDGMRYAMIKRSPNSEGSVSSYNRDVIEAMDGIITTRILGRIPENPIENGEMTVRIMSAGVAIIGESFWQTKKAYDALEVNWTNSPTNHKSNDWLDQQFREHYEAGEFETLHEVGNPDQMLQNSDHVIEAVYENPYWAHACMEPHNCIANITENTAEVIVGHQTTARVARITHTLTNVPLENVDVKICRMGTGLGRKSHRDFVYEAVTLSRDLKMPIKVVWTREDEIEQDYFNPKARHVLKAAIDANTISAMTYTLLCSNNNTIAAHTFPAHALPHFRSEIAVVEGLQTGPWRGPMENISGFTNQSFLDEIAAATNQDPYEFQVSLLSGKGQAEYETWDDLPVNHDRLLNVLKIAAEKSGWQKKRPRTRGVGRGIACHFTFGGYAAWVIDIKVDDDGTLHILKATGAIDCGVAVNKLGVKAQMEGGALDGFSAALNQFVDYQNGQVTSNNYDNYSMARLADLETEFDIHIVKSDEHPTGTGEIGLPPAIPALLNAIYDATGIRIRKLPIGDQLANGF